MRTFSSVLKPFLIGAAIGLLLGLGLVQCAFADEPNSENTVVKAVMFEIEYDAEGNIRHAQAIGGYPSAEACVGALPSVLALAMGKVDKGLIPQVFCTSVKVDAKQSPRPARASGSVDL
jgi:hypothetical protein